MVKILLIKPQRTGSKDRESVNQSAFTLTNSVFRKKGAFIFSSIVNNLLYLFFNYFGKYIVI